MAVEYTLKIQQIDCIPELDGKKDVVRCIHWAYVAKDGENSAGFGGSTEVPLADGEFIPYAELTEDQLRTWVLAAMPVADIESVLADQMNLQSKPLPWADNDNG